MEIINLDARNITAGNLNTATVNVNTKIRTTNLDEYRALMTELETVLEKLKAFEFKQILE